MDKQKILIIAGVIVFILIIILTIGIKKVGRTEPITLNFWGVYDDINFYSDLIKSYQEENKHITINYQKKPFADYEKELINAMAAGQGPDIFSIHNTWLPDYKDKLEPMPQTKEFITSKVFQDTWVDVAYQDFVDEGEIYAIPFYVDSLALYYNKDLFNSAGIPQPPVIWSEVLDDAELLTKRDQWGNIENSGIAMGTAENINRSTDILALLMLQTGVEMTDANHTHAILDQGVEALRFYTDFSNPVKRIYCWNRQMPYSIDAFYQGKTAMMINYSYHIDTIRTKAPYLNFAVVSAPQIEGRSFDVNYANYWGQAVSKNSKHSEEAWKFILYLSQRENNREYLEKSKRPTSRRDLVKWQRENSDLAIFANQSLTAQSWYQIDSQAIEKIFADMIKSIVLNAVDIEQGLDKATDQINILMKNNL